MAASLGLLSLLPKSIKSFEKRSKTVEYTDVNLKVMESLGSSVTEDELLIIKKQRTRTMKIMEKIFKEVDVFLLLTTSRFPEKIESYHQGRGYINSWVFTHHIHYSALSSLSGIPSLAISIGHDKQTNLPIALQLMSKWWTEDLLLSVGYQIEKLFPQTSTPIHHVNVLETSE
ncbi:Fatty acid amide hydrolase [Thelohanellus kitauei]|uniref:Fatty acid amide hydrolase n=1 Tax=Thelohanellus kitauei TaxID=669202 RepID=A0A0C2MF05_THEKT|nr:Fatty acid amide hydrolase [Thelohanellus kitauei]